MRYVLLTCLALSLSACGFTPMYGTAFDSQQSADIKATLAQIHIDNIPDREGQYLRNALIDRFYTTGRPANARYDLQIQKIEEVVNDLDITKSSNATRGQLTLNTSMALKDKQTGEIVLTRALSSSTSYNILTSEFANRVSENNTRRNALDDLAAQIELQIGLFLKQK